MDTPLYRGFITLELLIAFFVGITFLSAAIMTIASSQTSSSHVSLENGTRITLDTILDTRALIHTTQTFESNALERNISWKTPLAHHEQEPFTTEPTAQYLSPCSMSLAMETTWELPQSRLREITIRGSKTHTKTTHALGRSACDPLPPTSWRNPENPHWETDADEIRGVQTGLAYARVDGVPYVFATTMNTVQDDDLWIVNMDDTEHPTVTVSLETGDETHTTGLLDIVVVASTTYTYAYVLQNSPIDQLQVIDVSDPTAPVGPVTTLSFDIYGVSPAGSNPEGRVITYYDNRLYIGLRTTIGPEFLVFDIRNDPEHPTFIGALPHSFDHSIYDIALDDGYAYLAIKPGSPPSGLPTRELMVIDIRNTIRDTGGGFNATTSTNDTEGGAALFVQGNRLYMGRERVSNPAERDFYIFDIASSTRPTYVASRRLLLGTGSTMGTPRVTDLVVQGHVAFITTTDITRSFLTYDIERDNTNPSSITGACVSSLTLSRPTKILYRDGFLYTFFGITPTIGIIRDNTSLCPL